MFEIGNSSVTEYGTLAISASSRAINEKRYFIYNEVFEQVAIDGVIELVIVAGAIPMHAVAIVDTGGRSRYKSYVNNVIAALGDPAPTYNRYIDDAAEPLGAIYNTPTITSYGTMRFDRLIGSGEKHFTTGGSVGGTTKSVISPSYAVAVIVENTSGAEIDIGIAIEWYEEEV